MTHPITCANCGGPAAGPPGPPTGWQLEDGRIVCPDCFTADLRATVRAAQFAKALRHLHDIDP